MHAVESGNLAIKFSCIISDTVCCRGSFGDWNNKSQHYIVEPMSLEDASVSKEPSLHF